jgi:hypothetical protein
MQPIESIPDQDSIHRLIDFPRMYDDVKGLIWENVFQFPNGEPESVVWAKYALTASDIHRIGCEREATVRKRRPETNMLYAGFMSAVAGLVREVRTRPGHGFSVTHEPKEGIHHAEISYQPAAGATLKRSEKSELKFALRKVFGTLKSHSSI